MSGTGGGSGQGSPGYGETAGAEAAMNPGDQAPAGTPATGENLCRDCQGTGKLAGGEDCPTCGGTGHVIEGISAGA